MTTEHLSLTQEWQNFLEQQPEITTRPNNDQANWFAPLPHWEIISVSGDDATSFLQGQISCDMEEVIQDGPKLACCVNLKGRVIANFIVYTLNNTGKPKFILLCPQGMRAKIETVLKKYAVFSKVTIEVDNTLCLTAYKNSTGLQEKATGIHTIQIKHLDIDFCLEPQDQILEKWRRLALTGALGSFEYEVIQQGMVFIYPATSEHFTPQECNLELLDSISFTKGCYTGQEVVARLHYRGKTKRRVFIAELKANENLSILNSTALQDGELQSDVLDTNQKSQGKVIDITHFDEQHYALLSLSIDEFKQFSGSRLELMLNSNSSETAFIISQLSSPPYSLES